MIQEANRLTNVTEYYFSTKLKEVRQLIAEGKPVINLGIGSPDLLPPNAVINALENSLNHQSVHQYQPYQGISELRDAISDFYKTYFDVSIDPNNEVLPLMGSKEGIMHITMAFVNSGDQVLIPNPGYPTYSSVCNLIGAEAILYDLNEDNNWLPNLEALEKMDLSRVKLMWISYPHMPTGVIATIDDLQKIANFAKKHQILLVNDNPYSFILNENYVSLLKVNNCESNVLELNSLSKTFNMSGWRVGMLLGNAELLKSVLKVKSNMDSGMFFGIQRAAVAAMKTNKTWLDNQNEIYSQRKKICINIAEKLGCEVLQNTVGLFVWAKLPKNEMISTKFIDNILYEKHIFITPGSIFGSNGEGYVRFSLCVDEKQLKTALNRI